MDAAAYLYPWDIVDDPAAPDLIASLGLDHVVLAAVHHSVRAATPRHPRHRIVVADRTAAYYPGGPGFAAWMGSADPFGSAVMSLNASGVRTHAWLVVNHVDVPTPGEDHVANAFGDRYPWALCPAREAVIDYATGLARDVASLPGVDGVEWESCGWYGFDHLSAHDKTAMPTSAALEFLLSLCFCDACRDAFGAAGIDPIALRGRVRVEADRLIGAGGPAGATSGRRSRMHSAPRSPARC